MPSREELISRIVASLRFSDPEWDIVPGSPEYKMVESFAQELASLSFDQFIHDFHFDIEKKSGLDLDNFVAMFGFQRVLSKRATGVVRFTRGTPDPDNDYVVPLGTQVYVPANEDSPAIFFTTTNSVVLSAGETSVESPVEAVLGGRSGNVGVGAILLISRSIDGITGVINDEPTAGGRDQETDRELRARWRRTVFRNLAGTEDQFLGIAFEQRGVTKAVVIGPVERFREQLEIAAAAATSQVPDAKYTFPEGGEFLGYNLGTPDEDLGVRSTHYNIDGATPVNITINDSVKFPNGAVIDFEHEYTPTSSRNDPGAATPVLDKVDVFIAGEEEEEVTEELLIKRDAGHTFNVTPGDALENVNWVREDDTTNPTNGNFLTEMFKAPLIDIPESITTSVATYDKDDDYYLVRHDTLDRNSTRARDGIEWVKQNEIQTVLVGSGATTGNFTLTFNGETTGNIAYNATAATVQTALEGLPSVSPGDVSVTGGTANDSDGVQVEFTGSLAEDAQSLMAATQGTVDDTVTVTRDQPGTPEADTRVTITYSFNSLVETVDAHANLVRLVGTDVLTHEGRVVRLRFNLAVVLKPSFQLTNAQVDIEQAITTWLGLKDFQDNIQLADVYEVVGRVPSVDNVRLLDNTEEVDEVQTLVITATGGNYTLTLDGETTNSLAYNAADTVIQAALEALSNVAPSDIAVSNSGSDRVLTFQGGNWSGRDVPLITVNDVDLSGGTVVAEETTKGVGYGIQVLATDERTILSTNTQDFYFDSDEIPVLFDVHVRLKARNTFV